MTFLESAVLWLVAGYMVGQLVVVLALALREWWYGR